MRPGQKWMALVAKMPCAVARHTPGQCSGRVEVHHLKAGVKMGEAREVDTLAIPLCHEHHVGPTGIHSGVKMFERLHRVSELDLLGETIALAMKGGDRNAVRKEGQGQDAAPEEVDFPTL